MSKKIFIQELKRIFKSPKRLFLIVLVPMLFFGFFGYVFREDTPKNLPVALTDYDQSPMSRQLVRWLDATTIMQISETAESPKAIENQLKRGDVYAYIIIPNDFEKNILQGQTTQALCYTNGNYMMPAGFIQSAFMQAVGTLSAGIDINKRMKQGTPQNQALAEVQSIRNDAHTLYNPYKNYNFFLSMGFVPLFFQMFVMIISIYTLGAMFKYRQARHQLKLAGGNSWALLLGKTLPYTFIFCILALLMDIYLFKVIGIPMQTSNYLATVFISFLLVLVNQSLAVFFVSVTADLRSALTYGGGFAALAFAFSGYTFPLGAMPEAVQYLAKIFPFTHFIQSYINTAVRGLPLSYSTENLIAFVVFISLVIVVFPKFKKRIHQNGYNEK